MYTENDILSELFNVLGLSKEDIKALKDECKDYVKDAYKKADEQKKAEKKIEKRDDAESCNGYVHVVKPEEPEPKENAITYTSEEYPEPQMVAKDVYSVGNRYFELSKHAGNAILGTDAVPIDFEEKIVDVYYPGITNKQLLWVLYVRYMQEPKKLALVKQLLATEF